MYRVWLWPLVIACIGLSSWAMVEYEPPKWLFVVPLAVVGVAIRLDLWLSGNDQRQTDTVLSNVTGQGDFGLSRGSQITLGVVALLFGLIMFAWASTAPGDTYFNKLPGLFCLLVAGACLLPSKYRGYCGDLIAFIVIGLAVWFLVASPWWQPGKNPLAFAWIYGGLSVAYLLRRHARRAKSNS